MAMRGRTTRALVTVGLRTTQRGLAVGNEQGEGDKPQPPRAARPSREWVQQRDTSHDRELFGTTAILDAPDAALTNVTGFFPAGFRINRQRLRGPVIITPHLVLSWNVPTDPKELQPEHLYAFLVMQPPIDMILVGTGRKTVRLPHVYKAIREFCPIDFCDSRSAAATFNMLSREGRSIGIAMLPMGPPPQ